MYDKEVIQQAFENYNPTLLEEVEKLINAFRANELKTTSNKVVIEKVDNKLLLNGREIGPGIIDVRLDGLTYRSAEKVEVRRVRP